MQSCMLPDRSGKTSSHVSETTIDSPPATASPPVAARLPARLSLIVRSSWDWLPAGRSLPPAAWRIRHAWLTGLLWTHVVGLPFFAIYRGYSVAHSVLEASTIGLLAAAATFTRWPARWRAAFAALGLVTSSAILVHFSGGVIEAHFHFFVIILLLALYEDWIPFLIALGYVVLHHGVAGQLAPEAVYNHPDAIAHPWKWALIHGGFVTAAAAGAVVSWRLNESARARVGEAMAQAVRSEEANEMKSRFIATTSHELRTPLTSIGGFATTLLHRWDYVGDTDKLKMLEIIEAQSSRLRGLIEDLLLLSAVESGNIPVRATSVELARALEQVVQEMDAGSNVDVDVAPGLLACVDERHVAQIAVNLISNAQKYGRPPIRIRARSTASWVELTVSDRGPGIPDSFLPQLFHTFTRATDEPGVEGSGLGLSIVRGLAEANGGNVDYEPNEPSGARFSVRLPHPPDAGH